MSDKRYGAEPVERAGREDYFGGWTLAEIAEPATYSCQPRQAQELARDLIAAQARIAELDSQATWFSKIARETTDKLAAAEATIASARWLITCWRAQSMMPNWYRKCADELEAALSPPAKGGE